MSEPLDASIVNTITRMETTLADLREGRAAGAFVVVLLGVDVPNKNVFSQAYYGCPDAVGSALFFAAANGLTKCIKREAATIAGQVPTVTVGDAAMDALRADRDDALAKLAALQAASGALAEGLRRAGANMPTYCETNVCDICARRLATSVVAYDVEAAPLVLCDGCREPATPVFDLPLGGLLRGVEALLPEVTP